MKKSIISFILIIIIVTILDYINLASFIGIKISNINWDFYMGTLNIITVLIIYVVTYKTLDKRAIKREQNKNEISILLIRNCYEECKEYIKFLNDEMVRKYVVPKIDFNSTNNDIISNIQNGPFENESIIVDLMKDGQVTKKQIEEYFKVKRKFREYVNMRIVTFDALHIYEPLKVDLLRLIDINLNKIKG